MKALPALRILRGKTTGAGGGGGGSRQPINVHMQNARKVYTQLTPCTKVRCGGWGFDFSTAGCVDL